MAGTDVSTLVALEAEICAIAASLAASRAQLLALVGEFDAARGWVASGARSCAHWLAELLDIELSTAREHVRVARALRELPVTKQQFDASELSYAKVRQLTRVATADNEAELVAIAHVCAAGELPRRLADWQRQNEPDRARERKWAERGLWFRDEPNGNRTLIAQLPAEQVTMLETLVDAEVLSGATNTSGAGTPLRHQRADAFARLIDRLIADASADASADAGRRVELVLHRRMGETSLGDGIVLPEPVARQFTCDADLRVMTHWADGSPADVGRRHRLVTPRLRRLVTERDGGRCRYPGCRARHFIEVHHIVHWEDGGQTLLTNLISLCGYHHRFVHEHGWPDGFDPYQAVGAASPRAA
ncbi:HNH endonuclease [Rhabdothermincola sp.]|uniref:HNH endonuclease n=1 Tax=Rhabdothermincola sp. TaxID=2820405 RepID=UPI002FE1EF34